MRRATGIALGAALAFAAILLARLPAAWILPAPLSGRCAALDGTLWSGTCSGVTLGSTTLGDLGWELRPLELFLGRVAAHVSLGEGPVHGAADVALGFGGKLLARNVRVEMPLDPALAPGVPASLRGDLHVQLARLEYARGALTGIAGRIELRDLIDRSHGDLPLGAYVVEFPDGPAGATAAGAPVGQLHDLGGPLALEGTLRLTQPPGVELAGTVAPRAGARPELLDGLRALGPADAAGRRPFSLAATF